MSEILYWNPIGKAKRTRSTKNDATFSGILSMLESMAPGEIRLFLDANAKVPVFAPTPENKQGAVKKLSLEAEAFIRDLRGYVKHVKPGKTGEVILGRLGFKLSPASLQTIPERHRYTDKDYRNGVVIGIRCRNQNTPSE